MIYSETEPDSAIRKIQIRDTGAVTMCDKRYTISGMRKASASLLILPLLFLFFQIPEGKAQTFSETVEKSVRFPDPGQTGNELFIRNIEGSVTVEGYDGDEVQIIYKKELRADSRRDLDRAKEEIEFVIEEEGGRILAYIDAPFIHVRKENGGFSYHINNRDTRYDFFFDISVRVPENSDLDISTINSGKVLVENMRGERISAANVNGTVELADVAGITDVHTVNGDITVSYSESPAGNSSYQTVNGTIEVFYPQNLSADITFRSMHGDLYTDFQNLQRLEARVETDKNRRGGGTAYRIDKFSPLRIGNGGPEFSFEVLNGDVYIKRNQSI